ncbi:MAG: hypothetical protein ABIQ02_10220 [Saprospiraceae bacterium]
MVTKTLQFGVFVTPQLTTVWNGSSFGKGKPALGYTGGVAIVKNMSAHLKLLTGIHVQQAELKQRSNNLRWPADVMNGEWVPGRSYEEFEAKYLSIGLNAGIILNLDKKENGWLLSSSVLLQRILKVTDQLVINESGFIREPIVDGFENVYQKTQLLINVGINYQFKTGHQSIIWIGPVFEYSIKDLILSSAVNNLWLYDGGHPVFFGLSTGIVFQ